MSMTEQEIRADERKRIVGALSGLRPFLLDVEGLGVSFAIKYIAGVRPAPDPAPKPVPMPDVPHLERQFGQFIKNAMAMMAALETLERSQAFLNEAAQKGWP